LAWRHIVGDSLYDDGVEIDAMEMGGMDVVVWGYIVWR
jgi:hypothetical protein